VHGANAPPSSAHWKVAPVSVAVNARLGDVSSDGSLGLVVIAVSGGVASRVVVATLLVTARGVTPTAKWSTAWFA